MPNGRAALHALPHRLVHQPGTAQGLQSHFFTIACVEFNFRRQSVNGWTYVRLVRHLGSSSCVPTRVRNLVGDRIRLEGGVKIVRTIHGILVTIYTSNWGLSQPIIMSIAVNLLAQAMS